MPLLPTILPPIPHFSKQPFAGPIVPTGFFFISFPTQNFLLFYDIQFHSNQLTTVTYLSFSKHSKFFPLRSYPLQSGWLSQFWPIQFSPHGLLSYCQDVNRKFLWNTTLPNYMESHPMREYKKTDMFPHNFCVEIKFQWRIQNQRRDQYWKQEY